MGPNTSSNRKAIIQPKAFIQSEYNPKSCSFFTFYQLSNFPAILKGTNVHRIWKVDIFGLPHYLNQRSHDSFCVVNALANRIVIEWIISIELNDFGGQKRTIGKSTFVSFELKLPNGQKLEKSTPKKLNDEN